MIGRKTQSVPGPLQVAFSCIHGEDKGPGGHVVFIPGSRKSGWRIQTRLLLHDLIVECLLPMREIANSSEILGAFLGRYC